MNDVKSDIVSLKILCKMQDVLLVLILQSDQVISFAFCLCGCSAYQVTASLSGAHWELGDFSCVCN